MCSNQRNCSLQETGVFKAALRKKKTEREKKEILRKKNVSMTQAQSME